MNTGPFQGVQALDVLGDLSLNCYVRRIIGPVKVYFKEVISPELLNALVHGAKHVLSIATLRKHRDPSDPSRSLIISPAPQPMSYTA